MRLVSNVNLCFTKPVQMSEWQYSLQTLSKIPSLISITGGNDLDQRIRGVNSTDFTSGSGALVLYLVLLAALITAVVLLSVLQVYICYTLNLRRFMLCGFI